MLGLSASFHAKMVQIIIYEAERIPVREFNYEILPDGLLSPEIVKALTSLHEYKGKQELYLEANADVLSTLSNVAKVQSIDASNRIEGIYTADKRLIELVEKKTTPKNRNEEEIAGYRDVLAMIHENYDYIDSTPSVILQLHRDLYKYTKSAFAGSWKSTENVIAEIREDGQRVVRFKPVPAVAVPHAMEELYKTYQESLSRDLYDPLLLTCMFVLDFTCIHPFNDGNGRMSRLLSLLLLYRSGYQVGKYISIEKLIEQSKEIYYESLQSSSLRWHEGKNDYTPFVRYMLGVMTAAYKDFSSRVELVIGNMTKAERIEDIFNHKIGKITKRDILSRYPDVSETTVERTLSTLLKQGKIRKVDAGRAAGYVRNES